MKKILLPLKLPADGKGSPELNRLVAEGQLIFDPSTGNFFQPEEPTSFPVGIPDKKPTRLATGMDIDRYRTSDRARDSRFRY